MARSLRRSQPQTLVEIVDTHSANSSQNDRTPESQLRRTPVTSAFAHQDPFHSHPERPQYLYPEGALEEQSARASSAWTPTSKAARLSPVNENPAGMTALIKENDAERGAGGRLNGHSSATSHSTSESLRGSIPMWKFATSGALLPLPFILAYLAFDGRSASIEAVFEDGTHTTTEGFDKSVYALALTSITLLAVSTITRISSPVQGNGWKGTLDPSKRMVWDIDLSVASAIQIGWRILGLWLPLYAAIQLGLSGAGVGVLALLARRPERQNANAGAMDSVNGLLQHNKFKYLVILAIAISDILYHGGNSIGNLVLGYLAVTASLTVAPSPLTPLCSEHSQVGVSPLIGSPQDYVNTTWAGGLSGVVFLLAVTLYPSSGTITTHGIYLSTSAVAATVGIVFAASSGHSPRERDILSAASGAVLVTTAGWYTSTPYFLSSIALSALAFTASYFDVRVSTAVTQHDHHTHKHNTNRSRISNWLLSFTTPGSVLHTVLSERDSRRIAYFGCINMAFMLVQFFYGFATGSLGLLTDSIHMLFDCLGLAVGLAAAVMSKWPPSVNFPYGYARIDKLSGFANGIFLILVSLEIIVDASHRLRGTNKTKYGYQ